VESRIVSQCLAGAIYGFASRTYRLYRPSWRSSTRSMELFLSRRSNGTAVDILVWEESKPFAVALTVCKTAAHEARQCEARDGKLHVR
jgi:hypothetical protein